MILKIYTDDHYDRGIDVPVTPQSTVSDILNCCRDSKNNDDQFQLIETWQNHERVAGLDERPFEMLMRRGAQKNEVRFHLRQNYGDGQFGDYSFPLDHTRMTGTDITYEEMQARVIHQRRLIEQQRHLILAKEQRLRFLRQQEHLHSRHRGGDQPDYDSPQRFEKTLNLLKATRGEAAGQTSLVNQEIENEFENYRQVFNETGKELSLITQKTDALTKKLHDFHMTRCEPSIAEECRRLRSELIMRKKLNDGQNVKIISQNQALVRRREEVASLDAKIAALQNRLRISELQRQNEKNIRASGDAAVAAVEPFDRSEVRNAPNDEIPGRSKMDSSTTKSQNEFRPNVPTTAEYWKTNSSEPSSRSLTTGSSQAHLRTKMASTSREGASDTPTSGLTSPTIAWKNGPTVERQSSPSVPPTRFMPPFSASVILPSKGTAPTYAVSGGGARHLQGYSGDSSAFQRSPSGRYHLNADPFQATGNAAGASHPASSLPKSAVVSSGFDVDAGQPKNQHHQSHDPRAINNFIPMTIVKNEAAQMEFSDQKSGARQHDGDAYSSLPIDQRRSPSGDYRGNYSDVYAARSRSPQPRFASMSVITDTYFRKPGAGIQDPRRTGETAGNNPQRRHQTSVPNQAPGRNVASPNSATRPTQNNDHSSHSGNSRSAVDVRLSGRSGNQGFYSAVENAQIPNPSAVNKGGGYFSQNSEAPRSTSSSHFGYPYHVDRSNPIQPSVSSLRDYDSTDYGIPRPKDGKRISFSDEHFIPTDDTLYKLDGYGSFYHPGRISGELERSSGHLRMNNFPKPLRRRLSGDSSDNSLVRPAKYQQNSLVAEISLNSARPLTSFSILENRSRQSDIFQTVNAPAPVASTPIQSPAPPENQANIQSYRGFSADISQSFSSSSSRVLSSPVVIKPPEIPNSVDHILPPNFPQSPNDTGNNNSEHSKDLEPLESKVVSPRPDLHANISLTSPLTVSSPILSPPPPPLPTVPPPDDCITPTTASSVDVPAKDDFERNPNGVVVEAELPLEGEPDPVAVFVPEPGGASKRSNLKKTRPGQRNANRVKFDPMVLLLDACLEGEIDTVMKTAKQVDDPSMPNDEGITALHNAICAGHFPIVKFLVEFGCDVNAADTDGWTPLHCSASCNNLEMTRLLVENGACVFAVTTSDQETASEKCERDEEGFETCHKYLLDMEEKLGKSNHGTVYALYDYTAQADDELSFQCGDKITVVRKGDEVASQWWFSRHQRKEGYVPRNYLGAFPRIAPKWNSSEK